MLTVCAALIGRIIIIDTHEDYITAAENHSTYKLTLAATRGKIYDRNGVASCGRGVLSESVDYSFVKNGSGTDGKATDRKIQFHYATA